jgi:CheY-like chemotaxis protein
LPDTELTSDATVEHDILLFLSQRAASSSNAALLQIPITAPDGRRLGFIAVLAPSDFVGLHASTCREAAIACAHAAAQQAREAETDERIVALMESLADFYGARRTEGEPVEPSNSAVPAAPPTALASAAQSLEKPLGAILSELRRLQAQIQDPATYQSLSGMTRQCRKLGSILDDMRFLSGSEPPDYGVSLLNVPIRLYMRSARQNLERSGLSVAEKYSDGLPRVHMDSRRIVHALANVLAFVEQKLESIGGGVTILTDAAADRSLAWIRVKIEGHASANPLDAGPVNLSSLDIPSEMGLAYEVCHSILSEHGGRFSIETSEHTAEFTMALPAALGAATVRVDDHAPSAAQEVGDNVVSVLIADDDDSVRDILRQALRMRGYGTEVARDGVEALNCLIEKHIDVVLLDLLMPNRDGLAVLRELQRRDNPPPVIFMTGNGAPDVRDEALALGAHAFLQKPFELRRLLAEIESVLIKK